MKQSLSFFSNTKNLLNDVVEKNKTTTISCPNFELVPFVLSYIKKRKVFVFTKKQEGHILSYFDYQKETFAFFLNKEGFDSFGVFKSFKSQLFNISKSRCGLFWDKIDLCLVNGALFDSFLFAPVSQKKTLTLNKKKPLSFEELVCFLNKNNYTKTKTLQNNGDFVVRGGVVDIFPYSSFLCLRVSFLDEKKLSLFLFEKENLYSSKSLDFFVLGKEENKPTASIKTLSAKKTLLISLKNKKLTVYNKKGSGSQFLNFNFKPFSFAEYKKNKTKIKTTPFLNGNFGFSVDEDLSFAPSWFKSNKKNQKPRVLLDLKNMFVGDYYIHEDFGVCVFLGVDSFVDKSEFVCLQFEDGRVKISVEKINKLFFLSEEQKPHKLSSLSRKRAWVGRKKKYFNLASLYVSSLVDLYNKRNKISKKPNVISLSLSSMFASFFPHILTQDQKVTLSEVFNDMVSPKPMSRLICGDVGFGKTEVALRASFLAASNNKNIIVLAPTRILVDQLYDVFYKRFKPFSCPVFCSVSSFLSCEINGRVLISTHQVLSSPKALSLCGLFIVDEEHRFGVEQKERVLKNNISCDVLYMTATPLPRTLQMSFSKIRNFSLIKTPPVSKKPTITNLYVFDKRLIVNIIKEEVLRGGQVYIVDSSINNVVSLFLFLSSSLPSLSVDFLHSKRSLFDIKKTMSLFRSGKTKALVSTSIIESGIDIGLVNSIIINNSHCFGLSQLYQLRGRVGRSNIQSFAYFLIPRKKPKSEKYIQRLSSLKKNQKLGSGYGVAVDDLNIRGAGSLFGYKQSGGGGVGFEFYTKLVSDVFNNRDFSEFSSEVVLSLGPSYIPSSFAFTSEERLQIYRSISSFSSLVDLKTYRKNISSSFGELSGPFLQLFINKELFLLFQKTCVKSVVLKGGFLFISLNKSSVFYKNSLLFSCKRFFVEKGFNPLFLNKKNELKIHLNKKSKDVYILMKLFVGVLVVK